jgi:uncharacterized protein
MLFACFGCIFFALGAIGVFLPILPSTPFLLLASFCFVKSSKRFSNWFASTKLYKRHLDSFIQKSAMPLKTKIAILAFASTMLVIAFITVDIIWVRVVIGLLIAFKYYYFIFRVKTIKPEKTITSKDTVSATE